MMYRVAHVTVLGRRVGVVLQNSNGPCPLLAVFNALAMRGAVELHRDQETVTFEEMALMLRQRLEQRIAQHGDDGVGEERLAMSVQECEDCVSLLPRMEAGLDVNVRFDSCTGFEYTKEVALFDSFGTRLVHGWVYDPQDTATAAALGDASYNQLVNRLTAELPADADAAAEEEARRADARAFLERTAGQLTVAGLSRMHEELRQGEIAVLFRNNHFGTVLRHGPHLFALVTDQGIMAAHRTVVWQRLGDIDGDDAFVDAEFVPVREGAQQRDNDDASAALAAQLQEQENAHYQAQRSRERRAEEERRQRQRYLELQREEEARRAAEAERRRKKDKCTVM